MIAQAVPSDGSRHRIYSSIQIGVNVSAAIGPLIATSVYAVWGDKAVLWGSASFYILATILVRARIPHGFHLADEGRRWPISRQTMRQVFLDRVNIQACLATLIGYFLYAQFFSAIALLVTIFVPKGPIQGFLFFENAVLVVALQPPASRIVERKLHAGTSASRVMITGMAIFSVALMVLGVALSLGLSVFAAALIGIAIFSLAETVYTPTVNTAFARIQASSPLESFNVQQVLMAAGQAGGTLVGTTIFLSLAAHSTGVPYWIILGTAGLAAAAGSWLVKVRKTEGEGATA
jgi:MFS family permease